MPKLQRPPRLSGLMSEDSNLVVAGSTAGSNLVASMKK